MQFANPLKPFTQGYPFVRRKGYIKLEKKADYHEYLGTPPIPSPIGI